MENYQLQMRENARIVIDLIRELSKGDLLTEFILWDFNQLTEWWLEKSGVDLNWLTTEIQSALEVFVFKESSLTLSREKLMYRYAANSRVDLEYKSPGKNQWMPLVQDSNPVLGPIGLRVGGTTRVMQLAEKSNITSAKISKYKEGVITDILGGKCLVWFGYGGSKIEQLDDSVKKEMTDFYTGNSVEYAKLKGKYWIGGYGGAKIFEECGVKTDLQTECRFKCNYKINISKGILLRIDVVFLRVRSGQEDFILWIDGQKAKQGLPDKNGRFLTKPKRLCLEHPASTINVQVDDGNDESILQKETYKNPLIDGPLLFIDGKLSHNEILYCDFNLCLSSKNPEMLGLILVSKVADKIDKKNNCRFEVLGSLYDESYNILRITPDDCKGVFISFVIGGREYLIFGKAPISLLGADNSLSHRGVQITGENATFPVRDLANLSILIPEKIIQSLPNIKFVVKSSLSESRSLLLNALDWELEKKDGENYGKYKIENLIEDVSGKFKGIMVAMHLSSNQNTATQKLILYLVPDEFELREADPGGFPSIKLPDIEEAKSIEIKSTKRMESNPDLDIPKAKAWLVSSKYGDISFEWTPPINYAVLHDGNGRTFLDGEIDFSSLSTGAAIRPLWKLNEEWQVIINDNEVLNTNELNDVFIGPVIQKYLTEESFGNRTELDLAIQRRSGVMPVRQWKLDLSISVSGLGLEWIGTGDTRILRASWNQSSCPGIAPVIEIMGDCGLLFYRQQHQVENKSSIEASIEKEIEFKDFNIKLLQLGTPANFIIKQGENVLAESLLPQLDVANGKDVGETKVEIIKLVELLENPSFYRGYKLHWLVVLVEAYMRNHDDYPIPNLAGIVKLLPRHGGSLIESQTMECLRALQYLQENKDHKRTATDLFEKESPLQPMLLSLHVVGEYRMYRMGWADIKMIQNISIIISNLLETGSLHEKVMSWLSLMLKLCNEMSDPESDKLQSKEYPSRSLLGFDDGVNKWMKEKR